MHNRYLQLKLIPFTNKYCLINY